MGEAEKNMHHVTHRVGGLEVRIARTATVRDGAPNGIHKRQRIRQLFGVHSCKRLLSTLRDTFRVD